MSWNIGSFEYASGETIIESDSQRFRRQVQEAAARGGGCIGYQHVVPKTEKGRCHCGAVEFERLIGAHGERLIRVTVTDVTLENFTVTDG